MFRDLKWSCIRKKTLKENGIQLIFSFAKQWRGRLVVFIDLMTQLAEIDHQLQASSKEEPCRSKLLRFLLLAEKRKG